MNRIVWASVLLFAAAMLPAAAEPAFIEVDVTVEPLPHTGIVMRAEISNSSRSDICIEDFAADINFPDGAEAAFYFDWTGALIDPRINALLARSKPPVLLLRKGDRATVESRYRLLLPDIAFFGLMNNPEAQAEALAAANLAIEADRYIVTPKLNYVRCAADASAKSDELVPQSLVRFVSGRRTATFEPIEVTGIVKTR